MADPTIEGLGPPEIVPSFRVGDFEGASGVPYLRPDGVEMTVTVRVYLQPGGGIADLVLPVDVAHRLGHQLTGIFHPAGPSTVPGWAGPAVYVEGVDA